jgi:hypothetical protein
MLQFATLVYLALPYYLFAWGWLRWPYAAALTLLLLIPLAARWRRIGQRPANDMDRLWPGGWHGVGLVLVTLVLLLPAGVGGIGYQLSDYTKHNAILHDLATKPWPAVLETQPNGEPQYFLVYYIAYYLPAAAVGRLVGLMAAHFALFAWTYIGLLLCARWVTRLVGGPAVVLIWAAWFLLSGMDVVFGTLLRTKPGEWWAEYWQYSGNYTLLVWVPQHMLGGWLCAALVMDDAEAGDLSQVGFAAGLTGLWSPFVTIGLGPVLLVAILKRGVRSLPTIANFVVGPAVLLVAVLFLRSVEQDKIPQGSIFRFHPWESVAFRWPYFCLGEFGVYALLIAPEVLQRRDGVRWDRPWFLAAVIALLLIPGYYIGRGNDFGMRASIPSLFVFWIVLVRTLTSGTLPWKSCRGAILIVCLLVASALPIKTLVYQVAHTQPRLNFADGTPEVTVNSLYELILPHYRGKADSPFFRHLARPAEQTLSHE